MGLIPASKFIGLLGESFTLFKKNDPLRLAGATAFFTTFALPPMLIIVIQLFGLVLRIEHLSDRFFIRLAEILGSESTKQIRSTFFGFKSLARNGYITVGGFIFLMFVATTLFKVIKDTLNQLWNIRLDTKGVLKVKLEKRAISIVVILLAGILFMTGTLAEGFQAILGHYFSARTGTFLNVLFNSLLSILIVTVWFSVLFKVLPDAKVSWKVVVWGGFFTGLLFTFGKFVITRMLAAGNINSVFGASTSIVFLLLFMFYSSFILYYGACFTKVYAQYINDPIQPAHHSFAFDVTVKKKEA